MNADWEPMRGGPRPAGTRRVDGFDGLRACAAVLVLTYHAGNVVGATSVGVLAPAVAELKGGVTIFFVISGFLLYLPYARAIRTGTQAPSWWLFAWRRAARILPGYWVALTVLAATGLITGVLGRHWWQFFGLAQIYERNALEGGLGVAWTLSVEVSFYASLFVLTLAGGVCLGAASWYLVERPAHAWARRREGVLMQRQPVTQHVPATVAGPPRDKAIA
jgi:peptidoglycan/LPS O-acetylase OafA/YrhL